MCESFWTGLILATLFGLASLLINSNITNAIEIVTDADTDCKSSENEDHPQRLNQIVEAYGLKYSER